VEQDPPELSGVSLTGTPIAPDVFTWPSDAPQLIGGRCAACGTVTFPRQPGCPRCGADRVDRELLSRRGTLFTFTTQEFLPKEPYAGPETEETFEGYALGYVELPGEVMVETRLTERDPAKLRIGMPVELVVVPFTVDAGGNQVLGFAFRPVEQDVEEDEAGGRG
jgi:uncharacterized protein